LSLWRSAKEEANFKIDCDEDETVHDSMTWIFKNLKTFELMINDAMSIQKFGLWIPLTHGILYKNHHVSMSITNLHALNLKEMIDYLSNSCYKWQKKMEIYPPTRLYNLCFSFWLLFCPNYFSFMIFFVCSLELIFLLLLCSITMLFHVFNRVIKSTEATWTFGTNVSKLKFNIRTNDAFESVKLMTNKEIN
jgi:hypothetical protein